MTEAQTTEAQTIREHRKQGGHRLYGNLAETEAYLIRLPFGASCGNRTLASPQDDRVAG
jgi:hypothetical protein